MGKSQSEAAIETSGLSKAYKDFRAVDSLDLRVETGEIFAFLGPNGAGKSTTIKMLTTLLRPSAGTARIFGYDVNENARAVRHHFGIVFQDPSLDDELSAWDNMLFHGAIYGQNRALRRERAEAMLMLLDLFDKRRERVKNFSGGMKRRLEIARGLMHEPRLLFLDEPTLGLDAQTRQLIWRYIGRLNQEKGLTVFFTTHYLEEAERAAQRIAIIDHGRIVALGSAEELKAETKANSLEEAYLQLTGADIREEGASALDRMRAARRLWRR